MRARHAPSTTIVLPSQPCHAAGTASSATCAYAIFWDGCAFDVAKCAGPCWLMPWRSSWTYGWPSMSTTNAK